MTTRLVLYPRPCWEQQSHPTSAHPPTVRVIWDGGGMGVGSEVRGGEGEEAGEAEGAK